MHNQLSKKIAVEPQVRLECKTSGDARRGKQGVDCMINIDCILLYKCWPNGKRINRFFSISTKSNAQHFHLPAWETFAFFSGLARITLFMLRFGISFVSLVRIYISLRTALFYSWNNGMTLFVLIDSVFRAFANKFLIEIALDYTHTCLWLYWSRSMAMRFFVAVVVDSRETWILSSMLMERRQAFECLRCWIWYLCKFQLTLVPILKSKILWNSEKWPP